MDPEEPKEVNKNTETVVFDGWTYHCRPGVKKSVENVLAPYARTRTAAPAPTTAAPASDEQTEALAATIKDVVLGDDAEIHGKTPVGKASILLKRQKMLTDTLITRIHAAENLCHDLKGKLKEHGVDVELPFPPPPQVADSEEGTEELLPWPDPPIETPDPEEGED